MLTLILFLLLQQAQLDIQEQIDALTAERTQLIALQRDCAANQRDPARAAIQPRIDKLIALKADPVADAEIDAILDKLIQKAQTELDVLDDVKPGAECTEEKQAAARIADINRQLGKLETLKRK